MHLSRADRLPESHLAVRVVKLAIAAVLAAELIDEVVHQWYRVSRSAVGRWNRIDHRGGRRLRGAQLGFLVRRLPR